MVKVISQETFDAVVKENEEEFGMEKEEAVKDAIAQFEQQGVNLNNIVTSIKGSEVVVEAVKSLFNVANVEDIKSQLDVIQNCCRDDLAQRVLATSNGAYSALIKLVSNPELKVEVAQTFATVMDTNPDHLENQGMECLVDLLRENNPEAVKAGLDWLLVCCVKHEENRQSLIHFPGLVAQLATLCSSEDSQLVLRVCRVWIAMVQDDDVRVPFGKAHEHARILVEDFSALEILTKALVSQMSNMECLYLVLGALSALSVRNEYCQQVVDNQGLAFLIKALAENRQEAELVTRVLVLIKALAGNDKVKEDVGKSGGLPLILAAAQHHVLKAPPSEAACSALAAVCLRQRDNSKQVMENEGAAIITAIMEKHIKVRRVQSAAAAAIRNIVSREKNLSSLFIERGVEALLKNALSLHGDRIGDTLRSAQRDLGLKVELQEHWQGSKIAIKEDFRESKDIGTA